MSSLRTPLPRAIAAVVTVGAAVALVGAVQGGFDAGDPGVPNAVEGAPAALNDLRGLSVPSRVQVGTRAAGQVTRNRPVTTALEVRLQSSNSTVASVPSTIRLSESHAASSFRITTSGVGGCANITATDGTNTRSARIIVYPPATPDGAPLKLELSSPAGQSEPALHAAIYGTTVTATVTRSAQTRMDLLSSLTVNLSSTSRDVRVPSRVTIPSRSRSTSFDLTVSGRPECVVISASDGTNVSRRLLAFVDIGG